MKKRLRKDVNDFNEKRNDKQKPIPIARLDYLQKTYKCCGLKSSSDYSFEVPLSCATKKKKTNKLSNRDEGKMFVNRNKRDTRTIEELADKDALNENDDEHFKDGCFAKLIAIHTDQKLSTKQSKIIIITSSIAAAILTYILIFVKEED